MSKKLIQKLISHLTPAQKKELEHIIPFDEYKRKKHTKRARKKMSRAAIRRNKKKDKNGKSLAHPFYGKSHTPESKKKMSDYALNKRSPDHVPKGEKHWNVKLTLEQVKEIRSKYIPWKVTYQQLADEYGVSRTQIYKIINFKRWKV